MFPNLVFTLVGMVSYSDHQGITFRIKITVAIIINFSHTNNQIDQVPTKSFNGGPKKVSLILHKLPINLRASTVNGHPSNLGSHFLGLQSALKPVLFLQQVLGPVGYDGHLWHRMFFFVSRTM